MNPKRTRQPKEKSKKKKKTQEKILITKRKDSQKNPKSDKLRVQNKKRVKKVIIPTKVVNTRKKVVYAPYLMKFVGYIILTMRTLNQGMKEKAKRSLVCLERGDKPGWAGLLFPTNVRQKPVLGSDNKPGKLGKFEYNKHKYVFPRKFVYVSSLTKLANCAIKLTGTMQIKNQGMNKMIRKLSAWPERGDQPERGWSSISCQREKHSRFRYQFRYELRYQTKPW